MGVTESGVTEKEVLNNDQLGPPSSRVDQFPSTTTMGCPTSKLHPRNEELVKFKKKHDLSPIKAAQPVHIWVMGAVPGSAQELGKLIAAQHSYLVISEKTLLDAEAATSSDRGKLIREILQDNGLVSMSIVKDLITEAILAKCPGLKGVVFTDLPRCKCQVKMLKKIVGPVSIVIYMKWSDAALKTALRLEDDEEAFTKRMDEFNKHVVPLATQKKSFAVDGESGPSACMSACADVLNRVSVAGC